MAAPAAQGLDPALICAIGPRLERWKEGNAHSVVVVRKGVFVYERRFADEQAGRALNRHVLAAVVKP